jgi:hypothetical protein
MTSSVLFFFTSIGAAITTNKTCPSSGFYHFESDYLATEFSQIMRDLTEAKAQDAAQVKKVLNVSYLTMYSPGHLEASLTNLSDHKRNMGSCEEATHS